MVTEIETHDEVYRDDDTNREESAISLPNNLEISHEPITGIVVDLKESKGHAEFTKTLPEGRLDKADLSVIEKKELEIDRDFSKGSEVHIYTGRSRFKKVSKEEGLLFREERREEWRKKNKKQRSKQNSNESKITKKVSPELKDCVLLAGQSNPKLFEGIRETLGLENHQVIFGNFADGESKVQINKSVRDRKVFVLQTMAPDVNESLIETFLEIDALKRASAKEINVLMPLFPYARQDRKGDDERAPISAALFAKLLKASGADRIITVDIHSSQVAGFFDGPFDNLYAYPLLINGIKKNISVDEPVILVGADQGQGKRLDPVRSDLQIALKRLSLEQFALGYMSKFRSGPNEVERVEFIGDPALVKGRTAILWDDMTDTGGTILKDAEELMKKGAKRIIVVATFGIFSYGAVEKLRNAKFTDPKTQETKKLIDKFIVTDAVALTAGKGDFLEEVTLKEMLAGAIETISKGKGASLRGLRQIMSYDGEGHLVQ